MQAPFFSLQAVVSARRISSTPPLASPLLLLFHGRDGADTVSAINAAVRSALRPAHVVTVASVVPLDQTPKILHPALKLALEAAYHRAARHLPVEIAAEDALIILPDWDGSVTHSFDMHTRRNPVGIAAIDRQGTLIETYTGPESISYALRMARQLRAVAQIP